MRLQVPKNLSTATGHDTRTFSGKDRVAVGTKEGEIGLFDAASGKFIRRTRGAHRAAVLTVVSCAGGKYPLSRANDRTFRVCHSESETPQMHLFVTGAESTDIGGAREWVAWTPQGYYAASPGGEKLIGWHVSRGPDQSATFYPVERFRKSLYRPDVIGRLLEAGSVEKAAEAADAARGVKTPPAPRPRRRCRRR